MKRVIALLLTVGMILTLVGCGKSDDSKITGNDKSKATKENPVDLTMWCIAVESDSNHDAYVAGIAEFEEAHPEINFTWEATQNEAYKTKIKAAVSANELPDIFYTWGCAFLGDFVDAGRVYCVDDVYADYADELPELMMGNLKFDGKYYAAPITFNIVAMFSNMEILKKVGYDKVPATYDELIACCDALVAEGIIPFGCAGSETWCVTEYLEPIIQKTAGGALLNDIFNLRASWGNDDVTKAVNIFQEMVEKNYFDPEGAALSDNEIKENYKAGKYAFYINGTWNCADFDTAGMTDKIQIAEFPVIDSTKSKLGELIGGPTDGLAVAASSKNAEIAAESAFEIAKNICHHGYLNGNGLPTWTPDYPIDSINDLTKTVAEIVANSSVLVPFGDNAMPADIANTYLDYVSKIYASAINGEEFVAGLVKDIK
ncbi:MAG TPA: extracellular solute-binding protein [Mobilitalea sp.]|nr:extracellular solute-binding protein [Mobilitalea sp.]